MAQTSHFWINKDFLEDVLRNGDHDPQLQVEECKVYRGTNAGDNYATVVYRATAKAKTKRGVKEYKLVVKCVPESELRQKMIQESGLFEREVSMYTEVFPEFLRLEKRRSVSLLKSVPRCLFTEVAVGKEAIVLEDLAPFEFKMADRMKGVDVLHCQLVMKELGKFHSLSLAMKKYNREAFDKLVRPKKDLIYAMNNKEKAAPFTEGAMLSALTIMKGHPDCSRFVPTIEKLKDECFDLMNGFCQPNEPIAVLNHGDCWINNLLFRYVEEGGLQVPKEVKFLDFQISRYASPVLDILYFLFLGTSKQLRDKHLEDLLLVYYQSFTESMKLLGVDPGPFTYIALKRELNEKYMFGILTTISIIPFIVAEKNNVPDLDSMTEEDFFNAEKNPMYSANEGNEVLVSRLKEVLLDMEAKGYMNK